MFARYFLNSLVDIFHCVTCSHSETVTIDRSTEYAAASKRNSGLSGYSSVNHSTKFIASWLEYPGRGASTQVSRQKWLYIYTRTERFMTLFIQFDAHKKKSKPTQPIKLSTRKPSNLHSARIHRLPALLRRHRGQHHALPHPQLLAPAPRASANRILLRAVHNHLPIAADPREEHPHPGHARCHYTDVQLRERPHPAVRAVPCSLLSAHH